MSSCHNPSTDGARVFLGRTRQTTHGAVAADGGGAGSSGSGASVSSSSTLNILGSINMCKDS